MNCGFSGGFLFWLGKIAAEVLVGGCVVIGAAALFLLFYWWMLRRD